MSAGSENGVCAVDVWRLDLRASAPPDWGLLDARERAVADSFVYPADRERYGLTHCALRMLLSDQLEIAPADVPIAVGTSGKPFFAGVTQRLTFNISHSRHTALIAIGDGADIGIDVEDDDGVTDYNELIDTIFDGETAEQIHREEDRRKRRLFLRGWTRKEAIAKALGSGFLIDPKYFSVPLDRTGPWTVGLQSHATVFRLIDLSSANVFAALAVDGCEPRLVVRDYYPVG